MSIADQLGRAIVQASQRVEQVRSTVRRELTEERAALEQAVASPVDVATQRRELESLRDRRDALKDTVRELEAARAAAQRALGASVARVTGRAEDRARADAEGRASSELRAQLAELVLDFGLEGKAAEGGRSMTAAQLLAALPRLVEAAREVRKRMVAEAEAVTRSLHTHREALAEGRLLADDVDAAMRHADAVSERVRRLHDVRLLTRDIRTASARRLLRLRREVFEPRLDRARTQRQAGYAGSDGSLLSS